MEEFYEKYGDIKVKFKSYYKYVFTYEAMLADGKRLVVKCGGTPGDIYRHEVQADEYEYVGVIYPVEGHVYDGETIVASYNS